MGFSEAVVLAAAFLIWVQARAARAAHWLVRELSAWPAQSTVEYALVGALVVIAAAGAMTLLGGEVTSVFSRITTTLGSGAGH